MAVSPRQGQGTLLRFMELCQEICCQCSFRSQLCWPARQWLQFDQCWKWNILTTPDWLISYINVTFLLIDIHIIRTLLGGVLLSRTSEIDILSDVTRWLTTGSHHCALVCWSLCVSVLVSTHTWWVTLFVAESTATPLYIETTEVFSARTHSFLSHLRTFKKL